MKLKLPNVLTKSIGRQVLVAKKNSPTILFAGGVVGVVGATVLACRATLRLDEVLQETEEQLDMAKRALDEHSDKYSTQDYQRDLTLIYIRSGVKMAKLYGPAFVLGVTSIAALTGSYRILNSRNAALTAAYGALEKGFDEYRKRVVDELGEDKDREFRYGYEEHTLVEDTDKGPKKVNVKRVAGREASVHARFFDEYTRNWQTNPEYNLLFIKCQQDYANDMLQARGHIFLNEVYDMLGIERSQAGAVVGWVLNKDSNNYIDFGVFDGTNPRARDFVNGREGAILLDFNVDGIIYDKI